MPELLQIACDDPDTASEARHFPRFLENHGCGLMHRPEASPEYRQRNHVIVVDSFRRREGIKLLANGVQMPMCAQRGP